MHPGLPGPQGSPLARTRCAHVSESQNEARQPGHYFWTLMPGAARRVWLRVGTHAQLPVVLPSGVTETCRQAGLFCEGLSRGWHGMRLRDCWKRRAEQPGAGRRVGVWRVTHLGLLCAATPPATQRGAGAAR